MEKKEPKRLRIKSGVSEWQTFQLLTARWLHTQYAGTEYPALWIVLRLFRFFLFLSLSFRPRFGKGL